MYSARWKLVCVLVAITMVAVVMLAGVIPVNAQVNKPPVAQIDRIFPSPATEGEIVCFRGHGIDPDRFDLVVGYNWRSSIDGKLSTSGMFATRDLSVGEHVIHFKVKDRHGAWSAEDSQTLTIEPVKPNQPPEAYIDSITPSPATEGEIVCFKGHGTDPDRFDLVVGYNWRSSIDGKLSTSGMFATRGLSVGVHTIYFKVKDRHGKWSEEVSQILNVTLPSIKGDITGDGKPEVISTDGKELLVRDEKGPVWRLPTNARVEKLEDIDKNGVLDVKVSTPQKEFWYDGEGRLLQIVLKVLEEKESPLTKSSFSAWSYNTIENSVCWNAMKAERGLFWADLDGDLATAALSMGGLWHRDWGNCVDIGVVRHPTPFLWQYGWAFRIGDRPATRPVTGGWISMTCGGPTEWFYLYNKVLRGPNASPDNEADPEWWAVYVKHGDGGTGTSPVIPPFKYSTDVGDTWNTMQPPPSTFFATGDNRGDVYIYVYDPTNANFNPKRRIGNIGGECAAPAVADFNGDNYLDVIMANKGTTPPRFFLFLNDGTGAFNPIPMAIPPSFTGEIGRDAGMAADFTNDGNIDYAVIEWSSTGGPVKLWIWDSVVENWLSPQTLPISSTGLPEGMDTTLLFAVDPFPDIFLITKSPQIVYLLEQTNWGTWTAFPNIITPPISIPQQSFHGIAAGVFRCEELIVGVTDAIVGHDGWYSPSDPGAAWLYYGYHTLGFQSGAGNYEDIYDLNDPVDTNPGGGLGYVDAWDFDGDLKPELVATATHLGASAPGLGVFVIDDACTGFLSGNLENDVTAKRMWPIAAPSGPGVYKAKWYYDWPMFSHDTQRTGRADICGPRPFLVNDWVFDTGYEIWSSPAVGLDGTIYIGSQDVWMNPGDPMPRLYAINPDGTERWHFETTHYGKITASPAIGPDGTIYIATHEAPGSRPSPPCDPCPDIFAINPDGTEKWHLCLSFPPGVCGAGCEDDCCVGSDLAVINEGGMSVIYLGSWSGYLYRIEDHGTSGEIAWRTKISDYPLTFAPAVGPSGNIYIGTIRAFVGGGELVAVRPNGNIDWRVQLATTAGEIVCAPAVDIVYGDEAVYVGATDHQVHKVVGGNVVWSCLVGGDAVCSPAIKDLEPDGDIDIVFGTGSPDNKVYAITDVPPGNSWAPLWTFPTNGAIISSPAIDRPGTTYIGNNAGRVYAISKDGGASFSFFYQTNGGVWSSPAISRCKWSDGINWRLYVGSNDGNLYSLRGIDAR
uniref:PKD/Chitinase domain-containing protein n=1 Tax=Candidatus Methanophagaceae archaeon ANME-1 ERB6 TaxID=2759912 RepID=A0A7G9YXJ5_9EURY|nr:hypothetical protein JLLPAJDC_00041 [Methanosarcinales archaeon ANME-1 ERB6]